MGDLKKMYFKTDQGLEIQEILDVYTMRRAGIEESEIKKKIENYPEKFKVNFSKFSLRAYSTFEYRKFNEDF
jgi:hypothetical protein